MTVPDLAGRVALVTGASRRAGIGAAVAARLLAAGARVLVHSWSPHDAGQPHGADPAGPGAVLDGLGGPGPHLDHVELDLARPDSPPPWSNIRSNGSVRSTCSWSTTRTAATRTWPR